MKYIYNFQQGNAEGNKDMLNILGGKGANLAEICNLKVPVPPGFTLIPEAAVFFEDNLSESDALHRFNIQFEESWERLESIFKTTPYKDSLLLSVRSGAPISMPGMLDTVLNLGFNETSLRDLVSETKNAYFVYDSYRRFLQTYSVVVLDINPELFENKLECLENPTLGELVDLCHEFKKIIKDQGKVIPTCKREQLSEAIRAVYKSWYSERAVLYRQVNNIPEELGTAVTVQAMVYGNTNASSFTGVLFTRDCLTGAPKITGEYLSQAQGEDIVSGLITPDPISTYSSKEIARKIGYSEEERFSKIRSLEEIDPSLFYDLVAIGARLEKHFREVQDIEFTVEDGKIWILQTRNARKTKRANLSIQKNLFIEGIISKQELYKRTQHISLNVPEQFIFKDSQEEKLKRLGVGLAASSGIAVGQVVFDSEEASLKKYESVILVREQTDTCDLAGILASKGILTQKGGMTSHAAVVCRGVGLCCVVGANILIDSYSKTVKIGEKIFKEGDFLSIDGSSGIVYSGKLDFKRNPDNACFSSNGHAT